MSWGKEIVLALIAMVVMGLTLHSLNAVGAPRMIDTIVVHSTATPPNMDIGVTEVDGWHKAAGWHSVGYHYVIRRSGKVEAGRPEADIGAHVAGHNANSIGIALVGGVDALNKPVMNYSYRQLNALLGLLITLERKYPTVERVVGHSDLYKGKADPTFDVAQWYSGR